MAQSIVASFANMVAQAGINFAKMALLQELFGKKGALAQIKADAAAAGAAAYQALVGIPYVGPFRAPAGAAAAYVATLAFGDQIASAAGGYDIPAGVYPIAQLHAREMVLPAQYADVIRAMAGGGGTGETGAATEYHTHVNIHAWDGGSVDRWMQNGGDRKIADSIKRSHAAFRFR